MPERSAEPPKEPRLIRNRRPGRLEVDASGWWAYGCAEMGLKSEIPIKLNRPGGGSLLLQQWRLSLLLVFLSHNALGQWLNYPAPGTPRTRDGKPNLSAPVPRASDGKPDLSGVWRTEFAPPDENSTVFDVPGDYPSTFSKYFFNILADFKPEEAPIRPEAAELTRKNFGSGGNNPPAQCLPLGIPGADIFSYAPFKIIQTHGLIVILYEVDNTRRQIYTDGRKLPADPQPAWLGYSVGKWEGDTLVVDTAGFNDKSWLDASGHPHSEAMRVQERFHRLDFGHMDLQVTIDDPKMYFKPFTVKVTELLIPDSDILELFCNENEKDRPHLPSQ